MHTFPLNRMRRRFGLKSLGLDLRQTYTHADHTVYANIPGLIDTAAGSVSEKCVGNDYRMFYQTDSDNHPLVDVCDD